MSTVWIVGCHRGGQPGAVGNGETEVTITDKVLAHTFKILRSDKYKNLNWAQAVDLSVHEWAAITNNVRNGDTIIIPHLNAANSEGAEMYVLANDAVSNALANKLQNMTVSTLGVRSRGVKNGTDYRSSYYARNLGANGVLMEVCFIDSHSDMTKLKNNIAKYGEELARVVVEQCGGTWTGSGTTPPKPSKDLGKYKHLIGRDVNKDAIGVLVYISPHGLTQEYLRAINVYAYDKLVIGKQNTTNFHDIVTLGSADRGATDNKNVVTHRFKKGEVLQGKFLPV